jgi:hypothetical protein
MKIFSFYNKKQKQTSFSFLHFPLPFISAQIIEIIAVEGKSVSLQCPILGSDVAMVLWFKSTNGIPLYR